MKKAMRGDKNMCDHELKAGLGPSTIFGVISFFQPLENKFLKYFYTFIIKKKKTLDYNVKEQISRHFQAYIRKI